MQERTVAPFGAWRSQIRIEDIVGEVVVLGEPWIDGDDIYWLEGRPTEGGRRVLVRAAADGSTTDMTPAPANVRSRVHEYGGGSYVVAGGIVVYSEFTDGRLYRLDPGAEAAVPITPPGPWRYADLRADLPRRRFYAVREDHSAGVPVDAVNTIVAIPLDGGEATILVEGPDFVAAPRLSPDGDRLAWLEWDHPDMPWDATRLRVAPIGPDGTLGPSSLAAGGPDESIVQPEWAPDGTLAPDQRPDRLVEPVSAGRWPAAGTARPDGGGVRRSRLDLRPLVVRVRERRRDRHDRPVRWAGPPLPSRTRAPDR